MQSYETEVIYDISAVPEMLTPANGIITDYDHFADAILAARSLTVEFVDENEEVRKRLEGEWG